MTTPPTIPPMPAAVGVTHLKVYDTAAPDGLPGGSPHLHLVCTEMYCVTAGRGAVQTLGPDGYRELPLEPGGLVWFSPGVIHRLINHDGRLEITVVMQNAGLPEAGDFVLTFPPDVLADPAEYHRHAALSSRGEVFASHDAAARTRRDLAVRGFAEWRRRFDVEGPSALRPLYELSAALVRDRVPAWRDLWRTGPACAAATTGAQLDALAAGSTDHLMSGAMMTLPPPGQDRRLGMCGTLWTYPLPEGIPK
jgi:mannose-6-phosphate isomerase-like protein (cupin superfamily)